MIIDILSREHRNIERLLRVLEHELDIFDHAGRPDYEVIASIIAYFEVYTELYHHRQEDLIFAKLRLRDPAAVAKMGDLAQEHRKGADRLHRVAIAVANVRAGGEIPRANVDAVIRDFLAHERRHIMMEDRDFFPAAVKALTAQDWTENRIHAHAAQGPAVQRRHGSTLRRPRAHIMELEKEAEAERHYGTPDGCRHIDPAFRQLQSKPFRRPSSWP